MALSNISSLESSTTERRIEWKVSRPPFARLLAALLDETGTLWVVGGAVRDLLLSRSSRTTDLDVVIPSEAIPTARSTADKLGWAFYELDSVRDIARLVFTSNSDETLTCDISSLRGSDIHEDLGTRDFTINAMAVELDSATTPRLLDMHGGERDLQASILRQVSPMALSEDPIRLLRAPRLMAQFNLSVEPETELQIERLAEAVRLCSKERVRDELWRLYSSPNPDKAVEWLSSFGMLKHIFPEVAATRGVEQTAPHYQDVYSHTLCVVQWASVLRHWLAEGVPLNCDGIAPGLQELLEEYKYDLKRYFLIQPAAGRVRADWLIWYALLHDIGKPATAKRELTETLAEGEYVPPVSFIGHEKVSASLAGQRLSELRFSNTEIAAAVAVAKHHMRLHHLHSSFECSQISRRAVYRFFRDTGDQQYGINTGIDVVLLSLCDYLATYRDLPEKWPSFLDHARQLLNDAFGKEKNSVTAMEPLLNGTDVMRHLNIAPGERVGEILRDLLEAQAAGEFTTRDEALAYAEKHRSRRAV